MQMNSEIEKTKKIISDNVYMTLATASLDGRPWISPVFFAYDGDYNLFWVSNKDSLHSNLIRGNHRVAIVIFNSQAPQDEVDAVYIEAEVEELKDKDKIEHAAATLRARVTKDEFKVNQIGQVTKDAIWRIYQATPAAVSKLTEGEYINGQYVDKRIAIDLLAMQSA
jgi:nitroimidazol reductase NimA-like FMN-containing flavoprotein (pyridoxamine 5'-phosphate oxidase superfamily)